MRLVVVVAAPLLALSCAQPPEVEVVPGEGEGEGEAVAAVRFVEEAGVDFGSVDRGGTIEREIVIEPVAPATSVTILSDPPVLLGGRDVDMWTVVTQPDPVVTAEGSVVRVRFAPSIGGELLGKLVVAYGVKTEERVILDVAGTSVAPPEPEHIPGIRKAVYDGSFDVLPAFDALAPSSTEIASSLSIAERNGTDFFAVRFQGAIDVPADGSWSFSTTSDDGSRVIIDGATVVDNDGLHGPVEVAGVVELTQGFHAIEITFFEKTGGELLEVRWEGPGRAGELIPGNVLFQQ